MLFRFYALAGLGALSVHAGPSCITPERIQVVRSKMLEITSRSWERGTATEALIELEEQGVSIFGENPFPPPTLMLKSSPVITISQTVMSERPPGIKPLIADGAVGDPASMGVAFLITSKILNDQSFADAASQQLDFLLNDAPKADNGAISHRSEQVQLWSDFMYMGPPFIAYFGAFYNDIGLLRQAHQQLWRHIIMGGGEDPSLWGTGNAWAASGMVRVLQAIVKSSHYQEMLGEAQELADWTQEILSAAWAWQKPDGGLDSRPDEHDFPDASWTTLMAATTYRYAVLTGDESMIGNADKAQKFVCSNIGADGVLKNTVDPLNFGQQGTPSPEGQAFVLIMWAATRDYNTWKDAKRAPTMHGPKRASRMFKHARSLEANFIY